MSDVHVRVHAGGEQYAFPIEGVLEVAAVGDVVPVPGATAAVLGVRNLRGQVIPVVDLATLLGLAPTGRLGRIVVAEEGQRRAGLAVESIVEVGPLAGPTETAESDLLAGATLVEGKLIGIVNVNAALDAAASGESG